MKFFGKKFSAGLFMIVLMLTLIGCMMIYSASNPLKISQNHFQNFLKSYAFKQMIFMFLGIIVTLTIFLFSPRFISFITWIVYPGNILLLVAVLVIGTVRMGAQRWIAIGGFSLQPSEFCKITVILALAQYFSWDFQNRKTLRFLIIAFIIACTPMLLIIKQPDLGTAIIMLPILYTMLFFAGANYYYLGGTILMGVGTAPFLWMKLAQYQKDRLLTFINPNADPTGTGYTLLQSKVAIGSGGLSGKGWLNGTQTQLGFLPEKHTDFIFSVLGEEWGFVGAIILIFLYFLLLYYCLSIARQSKNITGKVASVGLAMMLFIHIFVNTAMTVGLMPITGLPLPFMSYGGSSLLTSFIAIGLLLNFNAQKHHF